MSIQPVHQNVHGQKITVRHYLNHDVKPRKEVWTDDKLYDAYPVYVQVQAKRQSTKFKSVANCYAAPEYFEEYLQSSWIKPLLDDEVAQITKQVLRAKPFDNDHFKLSVVLGDFTKRNYYLCHVIGTYLLIDYNKARHTDLRRHFKALHQAHPSAYNFGFERTEYSVQSLIDEESRSVLSLSESVPPAKVFSLIRAEATDCNPNVRALIEEYGMPLLLLDVYMEVMRPWVRRLPTVDFYTSDEFSMAFEQFCAFDKKNDPNLLSLLQAGVHKLSMKHPALEEILRNR